MFILREIIKAVNGRLLFGDPQSIIKGVSIDSRTIKSGELFIAIKGNRFDGHNFIQEAIQRGAKGIVVDSSQLRVDRPQLRVGREAAFIKVVDTRRALGNLAGFHRQRFNIPVIAITGSNGKTTTKDMLAWILSSRARVLKNPGTENNDIGIPLTLLKLDNTHDFAVLELGTNHFGEIAYLANIVQPSLGIITNIGPAHLEYLKNFLGVYREKLSLLKGLRLPKIAILNADQAWLKKPDIDKRAFVVSYAIKNKSDFSAKAIKLYSKKALGFSINSNQRQRVRLNTVGYVNIYNALAAIVAARLLGWDYKSITRRLGTFAFSHGRLRQIELNGISFIDDTYNANPASLSEALDVLDRFRVKGRKIFVMGDMLELGKSAEGFHRQAGVQVAQVCDVFISVGKFSQFAARWARKFGLGKDCVFSCQDPQQAGDLLFKVVKPNPRDLILVKGSRLMKMEKVLKSR